MTTPDPTPSPAAPPDDLVRRCTAYLSLGGLWNPEPTYDIQQGLFV